jgi:hypothetical protein
MIIRFPSSRKRSQSSTLISQRRLRILKKLSEKTEKELQSIRAEIERGAAVEPGDLIYDDVLGIIELARNVRNG